MNNKSDYLVLQRPLKGLYDLESGGWHTWNKVQGNALELNLKKFP